MKVTAENIAEELRKHESFEVRIEDAQVIERGLLEKFMVHTYSYILEDLPGLWGFLYNSRFINFLALRSRWPLAAMRHKRILKLLREFQPAIVISTETIPSGIVAYLKYKGLYRGKLVVAFSDYHLHPFWLYREADLYLCNIAQQADELQKLGFPKEKIAVVGATVSQKFLKDISKESARGQLGLLVTMPVVLITSGSLVRMTVKEVFLHLLRSIRSYQLVVLCGTNEKLKAELENISPPAHHPVKIYGYINNMEVFMSASDVLVGKTGGPTMVEAVIKRVPMIITDVRPGHELKNLEFLLNHHVVEFSRNKQEAAFLVEQVLSGKRWNFTQAYDAIISPKNSKSLLEALAIVTPNDTGIKVQNYQEKLA